MSPAGFTFKAHGYRLYDVPRASYPYARHAPVSRTDAELHDVQGVRMVQVNGRVFDHPVAQAAYGLSNLESFRITQDEFYLARARKQADRLIRRATRNGGSWYFPYSFSFDLHGLAEERVRPPWYSGMAQGQALSLFVRLAEATGEKQYRTAADATFASFLRPRGRATPWTVWVDGDGFLWLEEYAGPQPDRTYNGMMFGAWGLWDYWRLTKDARAEHLWDGALTTVVAYAPTIRNPGWVSSYCVSHPWSTAVGYHFIHISQLASLYEMSHHRDLARYAELLVDDYPPDVRGVASIGAGRHVAYRFDGNGRVVGRRTTVLVRPSSAPIDRRTRVKGRSGIWYRVSAGSLRGYYLPERAPSIVLRGSYLPMSWNPARLARLTGGPVVVRSFTSDGSVGRSRRVTPSEVPAFGVSSTAHWNGVRQALVADGPLAGYWVPLGSVAFG